ncbi:hypothetical protein MA16_Dca005018 [Dendrobium catenatum]|uniref:Uncharacterized protein n=1 Tax=Dendrobium catenatum TaxID=906689 RepID=A0A2I0WGM8_9ASPA|nr:hypothetical protein MA16_Dca005018 [Dendrobium catenatum]
MLSTLMDRSGPQQHRPKKGRFSLTAGGEPACLGGQPKGRKESGGPKGPTKLKRNGFLEGVRMAFWRDLVLVAVLAFFFSRAWEKASLLELRALYPWKLSARSTRKGWVHEGLNLLKRKSESGKWSSPPLRRNLHPLTKSLME